MTIQKTESYGIYRLTFASESKARIHSMVNGSLISNVYFKVDEVEYEDFGRLPNNVKSYFTKVLAEAFKN
jgi:hypothetical protein